METPFDTFEPNGWCPRLRVRWSAAGNGGAQLVMRADGDVVIDAPAHEPADQIRWGEDYIQSRCGSPCQAWTFWQARTYYGPLLAVVPF